MNQLKLKYTFRNLYRSRRQFTIDLQFFLPMITIYTLQWKDKFNSPRCEQEPGFIINWFGFQFDFRADDEDVEKWLWCKYYSKTKDLQDWPWKKIERK